MLVLQLAEHVFVGQSTIGISLFKLETPYADPHVRCCERCDAKTSAYSIFNHAVLRHLPGGRLPVRAKASAGSAARETCFREARYIGKCVTAAYSFIPYNRHYARAWPQAAGTH